MKNIEFYKNKTTETMMQDFVASDYESLNEFLDSEHKWKPKYAVGDIVSLPPRPGAKTIVKIDYECDCYICVDIGYLTGTLLPVFVGGGKLGYDHLRYAAECMPESGIEEKFGRLEYKAFLDKIAEIEEQGRP